MDRHGLEGYGFWWAILEMVAENADESGRVHAEYSIKTWAKLIGISPQTFRKLLSSCEVFGLVSVSSREDSCENMVRIEIANILKYRDEWTRKKGKNSGVTPEQLRCKEQIQNTDTEEDKSLSSKDLHGDGEDADPVPVASQSPEPVYELPLKGRAGQKTRNFPVTKELFDVWRDAYPLVDVRNELREIKAWLVSNPKKRPASDMSRFVNSWLNRSQNNLATREARASPNAPRQPVKTFQQQAEENVWDAVDRAVAGEAR